MPRVARHWASSAPTHCSWVPCLGCGHSKSGMVAPSGAGQGPRSQAWRTPSGHGSTSKPFYVAAFLFFVCNVVFAMVASNEELPLTRSWARLRDAIPGPGALFCPVASLPAFMCLSL